MKWYKIVLNANDLIKQLDKNIIVDFVALMVKYNAHPNLSLYNKNYEPNPASEITYIIRCPVEISEQIKITFSKLFPIEISTPAEEGIFKLLGK
jgi:hypothetical protein